ncbi:MAG: hypothetical protein ACOH15_11845 [Acetobacterium sp.]
MTMINSLSRRGFSTSDITVLFSVRIAAVGFIVNSFINRSTIYSRTVSENRMKWIQEVRGLLTDYSLEKKSDSADIEKNLQDIEIK